MPTDDSDWSDKVRQANEHLARHQKRANVVLALLFLLNAVLLALVVTHLWDHPWARP